MLAPPVLPLQLRAPPARSLQRQALESAIRVLPAHIKTDRAPPAAELALSARTAFKGQRHQSLAHPASCSLCKALVLLMPATLALRAHGAQPAWPCHAGLTLIMQKRAPQTWPHACRVPLTHQPPAERSLRNPVAASASLAITTRALIREMECRQIASHVHRVQSATITAPNCSRCHSPWGTSGRQIVQSMYSAAPMLRLPRSRAVEVATPQTGAARKALRAFSACSATGAAFQDSESSMRAHLKAMA